MVDYVKTTYPISLRRACRVVGIRDSVYRYQPNTARDDAVIAGLQQAVEKYPAYGFSKLFKILRAGAIDGITSGSTESIAD